MSPEHGFSVATWNLDKGGNSRYAMESELPATPPLYEKILEGIEILKTLGTEVIVLPDSHGWNTQIPIERLKQDSGFSFAVTMPLEDERFLEKQMDTNITFLTNLPVKFHDFVHLYNRNGLRATVSKEGEDIDIYAVYLDDEREKIRIQQTAALVREIGSHTNPAIILGDLNCTSKRDIKVISRTLQAMFETLPKTILAHPRISSVANYLSRRVLIRMHALTEKYRNHGPVLYLENEGFTDASVLDTSNTMPTTKMFPVPFINVDRVMVSGGLTIEDTTVLKDTRFSVSDHYPRIATITQIPQQD
jgi:endonuclease/exonuclease/phosphatase family metal-dependent hydrolase